MLTGLFGGLGLFLFGMKLMSEALQKSAGKGLKNILAKLTTNRIVGVTVGALVTAIIQSSSATTVMVVGFVNAGLMNLAQSLSIVLGANIGTTITAQLIAFKITKLALPAVAVGVFFRMFTKSPQKHYWGEIMVGFGLIFIGLSTMKAGFKPLSHNEEFRHLFVFFSSNPIMAVAAGALLTMIVQSSSATIGITIALASTGLITFPAAAALVLGENIGTTITANLAALGANRVAKQAALGHFMFNFLGVAYMLILMPFFIKFIDYFTPGDPNAVDSIARHIANLHTSFNIINMIVFIPLLGILAKICERVIKSDKIQKYTVAKISDKMVTTPAIAVGQTKNELIRMGEMAKDMLICNKNAITEMSQENVKKALEIESTLDKFDSELSEFLVHISRQNISDRSSNIINNMHHVLHNLEKIGDHAENISQSVNKMIEKKIKFSADAIDEVVEMMDVSYRFLSDTMTMYDKSDGTQAMPVNTDDEDSIDAMRKKYKKNHIKRLNKGKCSVEAGILFVDILNQLEKIGDHTFNIAQIMLGEEETAELHYQV